MKAQTAAVALAVVVCFLLGAPAVAQQWEGPAALAIRVTTDKGDPVENAQILLRVSEDDLDVGPAPSTTDARGEALISGLVEGEWYVEVTHPTYMLFAAYLDLRAGKKPAVGFSSQVNTQTSWTPLTVKFFKASPTFNRGSSRRKKSERPPPEVIREAPPTATPKPPEVVRPEPPVPQVVRPEPQPTAISEEPPAIETEDALQVSVAEQDVDPMETPAEEPPTAATEKAEIEPSSPPQGAEEPVQQPSTTESPADAPIEMPADLPVDEPAEMPTRMPAEMPTEMPAETPAEEPAEVPIEAPVELPVELPVEPTVDVAPMETPPPPVSDPVASAERTAAVMTEKTVEPPTEAPVELPVKDPVESPVENPVENPVESAAPSAVEADELAAAEEISDNTAAVLSEPEEQPAEVVVETAPTDAVEPAPAPVARATEEEVADSAAVAIGPDSKPSGTEAPTPTADERMTSPPATPSPEAEGSTGNATQSGRIPAYLRSAAAGTCRECQEGEWAVASEQAAARAGDPSNCSDEFLAMVAEGAKLLADTPASLLSNYVGPALTAMWRVEPGPARSRLQELLPPVTDPESNCQMAGVVLPAAANYSGYVVEAWDSLGGRSCRAGSSCAVGQAIWIDEPMIVQGRERTVVYEVFKNRSTRRERRARLTIYFQPPSPDWVPSGR